MLHAKSLPHRLWAKALNCATYIQNRSLHRYVKDKTPYEAWSGLKLEVTHFHIFGSHAWARIPSEKKKALDPQRTKCIFVGYPNDVKGYQLIYLSSDQLIIEHSVQFKESVSHVPQQSHADIFTLPPVQDDEHAHAEPKQRPKWAQTTLQYARDLIGDPADTSRTRSNFKEPLIALTATEPFPSKDIFLVQSLDPLSYGEATGNPFWETVMQEE
jgi:hypothetical protein